MNIIEKITESIFFKDLIAKINSLIDNSNELGGKVEFLEEIDTSKFEYLDKLEEVDDKASKTELNNTITNHNVSGTAHNDIRLLIQGLATRLNALADSDDTTLDQMSEIVAYIKANKSLIESITTDKVNVSDIINNLETNATNKPLSAAQGVALKQLVDALYDAKDSGALDGYTPVRGVDYWTPEDIEQINLENENFIIDELAKRGQLKPEFANSVEECTDTSKLYVLPDGYIYAYMTRTITGGTQEVVVDVNEGFSDDLRLSVSSGNTPTLAGFVTTPFIDFSQYPIDAEIRLSGISWAADANNTTGYAVVAYDENQTMVCPLYLYLGEHEDSTINMKYVANSYTDVVFTVRDINLERNFKYVRFCGNGTAANAVVQIVYNKEIESQTVTEWSSTGHAFIPADYENRILDLEEKTADHETRLTLLEANEDNNDIPAYWLAELEAKANTIQIVMENSGRNKSAFLWYTDSHWQYTNAKVSPLLLQYLIKNTSMNKVNFGGDIVSDPSELTHDKISYVYEWRKLIADLPNHHSVIGNHDNLHKGRDDADVENLVYSFLIAPEESANMVIGDGFYYYLDNPCEKTRYLYLDSGRFSISDVETEFIIDSLVSVPGGWHVVAISHIWFQYTSSSAPTVGSINAYMQKVLNIFDAYNARESGSITMVSEEQSYDFTECGGVVEFCIGGHIHVDYDFASTGGIPVIITASDTNQERSSDETEDSGTIGTITESAVFGIIANYDNNKITIVGVGRGTSREISY